MKNKLLAFINIVFVSLCLSTCHEDIAPLSPNILDPLNENIDLVDILGSQRQGLSWELRVDYNIRLEELGPALDRVQDIVIYKNGLLRFELSTNRTFFIDINSSPYIENCYEFYLRTEDGLSRVIGTHCE